MMSVDEQLFCVVRERILEKGEREQRLKARLEWELPELGEKV